MKKLRILRGILARTRADKLLTSFMVFFFAAALVIFLVEPDFHSYGDALWYSYVLIATVGFGDLAAKTLIGRLVSVLLSMYAMLALAIITGVVVNFYTQLIQINQNDSLTSVVDRLEHLDTLSQEELRELSGNVKRFRSKLPDKK